MFIKPKGNLKVLVQSFTEFKFRNLIPWLKVTHPGPRRQ